MVFKFAFLSVIFVQIIVASLQDYLVAQPAYNVEDG